MASTTPADEQVQLLHLMDDLHQEFPDLPAAYVDAQVVAVTRRLADAPVRAFIPVLVGRGARERLRHLW